MASSNDSTGSGSGKVPPKSGADPRKPSALIDLKATEVDIRDLKKAAVAPGGSPSQAASAVASAAADAAAKVASVAQPAAAATSKLPGVTPTQASESSASGASTASSGSNATPSSMPAGRQTTTSTSRSSLPPATAAATSRPASSGGGLRGAATHFAAGLAGGLLALLGADALLPGGGARQATGPDRATLQALERRLANVETAPGRDSSQIVAAFERRIAEIETTATQVRDQQARLQGETRQIGERLAAVPAAGTSADVERLGRLEEILKTLSEASAGDTQRGRIPQLASISAKLTDLETSLATQIATLRKGVTQEVDSRLGQSTEAAQAARAGTQRLDRELGTIKNEAAQSAQRISSLVTQADRAEAVIRGLRDEVGAIRESLSQMAKPADVASAVSPLTSKLSALEQNVQGVVRGEDDRRANVERIVMALELGNLKRTVERGAAFAGELAEVRRVVGTKVDLSALERFKDRGVTPATELERDFRSLAFRIIEADGQPKDAHWTERLLASAKSVVRVRRVDQGADDKGVEATVARMEQALKAGRLADVASEAGKLSEQARAPASAWFEKVNARAAVERAIAAIEQELKSSLSTQVPAAKKG